MKPAESGEEGRRLSLGLDHLYDVSLARPTDQLSGIEGGNAVQLLLDSSGGWWGIEHRPP